MTEFASIEMRPITVNKITYDILLACEKPDLAICLYNFYCYTSVWQKTNQPKCCTKYAAKGLGLSQAKIRQGKKILKDCGLIEDIIVKDDLNRIIGHYIKVNYCISHPHGFPQGGNGHTVEKHETNALITNNINALITNKEIHKENQLLHGKEKIPTVRDLFETAWAIYPGKKRGLDVEFSNFLHRAKKPLPGYPKFDSRTVAAKMKAAVEYQISYRLWCDKNSKWYPQWKGLQTWINQACWEEQHDDFNIQDAPKAPTEDASEKAVDELFNELNINEEY